MVHIVAIDSGNGGTNGAILKNKSGRVLTDYFPSVRSAVTGDSLGLGDQFEIEYEYVTWGKHKYVFGDDATKISRRAIESHRGSERYGNEFFEFLTAVSCARLGIKSGDVELTLFAPPGMYNKVAERMKSRLEGKTVALKMKSDSTPRKWKYSKVTVWPEGIGAASCFIFDKKGNVTNSEVLSGRVVIADLGMYTLDIVEMIDGNFNPEGLSTATWPNEGIFSHILSPILRVVKNMDPDFSFMTEHDIDQVLRRGVNEDNWDISSAGKSIDLQSAFEKHAERYAEWISNNVIDGNFNGLNGIRSLILVGGGAILVKPYLDEWYGHKTLEFGVGETKDVQPIFGNAIGGIRLAQATK